MVFNLVRIGSPEKENGAEVAEFSLAFWKLSISLEGERVSERSIESCETKALDWPTAKITKLASDRTN